MNKRYKTKLQDGRQVYLHRYLWEQEHGTIPAGMTIDHINGDTHDNDLSNLRMVTMQENNKNKAVARNNTSGVPGVMWHRPRGKWIAQVKVSRKMNHLGYFTDWFEAVCARMSANNQYGFHENHGRR